MLKLYHCPQTRSMRALWLLHELRAPFELVEMPFDLAVLRSPDYLAIHPLGRVPCLTDGALVLFESGAIIEYLCESHPRAALGRLSGHPERYPWLQWIHYSETIAVHVAALFQQHRFVPPEQRSQALCDLETRRLRKSIEVVANHLADRDYLLRSGFSAADVSVGCSLHLASQYVALGEFAGIASYYDRLRRRPAFLAALPSNHR